MKRDKKKPNKKTISKKKKLDDSVDDNSDNASSPTRDINKEVEEILNPQLPSDEEEGEDLFDDNLIEA